jgi:hypothetical protein
MSIRTSLKRKNKDLEHDLEKILQFVERAQVVTELEPYRTALLTRTRHLLTRARANLAWLQTGQDSLLPDVLSETSTLLQRVRLVNFRYLRGLYRTTDWDRVCLQTIGWIHMKHPKTIPYPAVFADDDVSIVPSRDLPFYFFPCLEQRGLRFQPLIFHEFGHLLYKCHEMELDMLVGDFQQTVEAALLPASQRNDQYAQQQARVRQSIVETWYKWVQELFCDAVGLTIGGPCFLNAFSEFIAKFQPSDFSRQPSDLHGSSHPVSWLRIILLAERADRNGFAKDAETVLEHWNDTAGLLHVAEDYHGFYTGALKAALTQTIDDMLVETAPLQCTGDEAVGVGWDFRTLNLVALLNKVWLEYSERPSGFPEWEASILLNMYGLRERLA